jgi:hypothetical protein
VRETRNGNVDDDNDTPSSFCRNTNSSTENLGETIPLDVFLVRETRSGNVDGDSGNVDGDSGNVDDDNDTPSTFYGRRPSAAGCRKTNSSTENLGETTSLNVFW